MRQWQDEHPEQRALMQIYQLKRRYGITFADYYRMIEAQDGGCAICGYRPKNIRLSVDHDHKTGQVRGLLCIKCNRGLPYFSDSPDRLDRAAKYLHKAEEVARIKELVT